MDESIELSPKHGVNPSVPHCVCCGKDYGVALLGKMEERNAPWNEREPSPTEVDCSVCYCMSKSMPITVNNFNEDTNLIEGFKYDPHAMGIPTLLTELQKLCREKIERLRDELRLTAFGKQKARKELEHCIEVLRASQDWIVDDLEVCKDD